MTNYSTFIKEGKIQKEEIKMKNTTKRDGFARIVARHIV
jgi:hypothetical protein